MARTTSELVQGLLLSDYGPTRSGATPSLTPFIDTASAIVDQVATCATAKGSTLTSTQLELIERWLAAHAYCQSDQPYAEKKTQEASAVYQGRTGMNLDGTKYGQMAQTLDPTGCLSTLSKRNRVRAIWLGKAPSAQTDYPDRD